MTATPPVVHAALTQHRVQILEFSPSLHWFISSWASDSNSNVGHTLMTPPAKQIDELVRNAALTPPTARSAEFVAQWRGNRHRTLVDRSGPNGTHRHHLVRHHSWQEAIGLHRHRMKRGETLVMSLSACGETDYFYGYRPARLRRRALLLRQETRRSRRRALAPRHQRLPQPRSDSLKPAPRQQFQPRASRNTTGNIARQYRPEHRADAHLPTAMALACSGNRRADLRVDRRRQ